MANVAIDNIHLEADDPCSPVMDDEGRAHLLVDLKNTANLRFRGDADAELRCESPGLSRIVNLIRDRDALAEMTAYTGISMCAPEILFLETVTAKAARKALNLAANQRGNEDMVYDELQALLEGDVEPVPIYPQGIVNLLRRSFDKALSIDFCLQGASALYPTQVLEDEHGSAYQTGEVFVDLGVVGGHVSVKSVAYMGDRERNWFRDLTEYDKMAVLLQGGIYEPNASPRQFPLKFLVEGDAVTTSDISRALEAIGLSTPFAFTMFGMDEVTTQAICAYPNSEITGDDAVDRLIDGHMYKHSSNGIWCAAGIKDNTPYTTRGHAHVRHLRRPQQDSSQGRDLVEEQVESGPEAVTSLTRSSVVQGGHFISTNRAIVAVHPLLTVMRVTY